MSKKFHPELIQSIKNQTLILFVGAGLSYNLTNIKNEKLGGWKNFVKQTLIYLKEKNFDVEHLIPLVDKYDPIKVLDLMESDTNISKTEITNFTKEFFDLNTEGNNFKLHRKLLQLSKKIITTNYDTAFEISDSNLRKHTAYKGKNYELTTHKDPKSPLLFKLHGCFENADTMVLFPSDYKDLYENKDQDAEHSLLVLKNIILNRTILFIGTGMGDFQINYLFAEIKRLQNKYNQNHFIITTKELDTSLNFLCPIKIGNHGEIEQIIDSLIFEKERLENQDPHEVIALRKELEEQKLELSKANKIINDQRDKEIIKDTLIAREAIEYFMKGLDFHLKKEYEYAIEKYKRATELNEKYDSAYNNWGTAIYELAKIKQDESLFQESFEKYKRATELNEKYDSAYNNWGTAISELAKIKQDESLFQESFEKYKRATELNEKYDSAFYNWGTAIYELAKIKQDESLFQESFEKYKRATELNEKDHSAFYNWGTAIYELAKIKQDESLFQESFEKLIRALNLGGGSYNLSCSYAYRKDKENALKYLRLSLEKQEVKVTFVENDTDWVYYYKDKDFVNLIDEFK